MKKEDFLASDLREEIDVLGTFLNPKDADPDKLVQRVRKCDGCLGATQKLPPIASFIASPPTGHLIVSNARSYSKSHDRQRSAIKWTTAIKDHAAAVGKLVRSEETVGTIKNEYDVASRLVTDHAPAKAEFAEQLTKAAALQLYEREVKDAGYEILKRASRRHLTMQRHGAQTRLPPPQMQT